MFKQLQKETFTLPAQPMEDPLKNSPTCSNCNGPHWPGEKYCADCGQRIKNGPPSIRELFSEFFETVFNLDNRLFRTLAALAIPGKLSREYSAGRRKPYLGPLRFFFISLVICLASFSALIRSSVGDDLEHDKIRRNRQGFYMVFNKELGKAMDSVRHAYPDTTHLAVLDSLDKRINREERHNYNQSYLSYKGGLAFEEREINISYDDLVSLSLTEIFEKYEVVGRIERYQVGQLIRLQNLTSNGISILMGQSVWGLLLIVPVQALMLKLIYLRRRRYYVEHFVFSLHNHTFLALLLTLATILYLTTGLNYLYWLTLIVAPVYFILAVKRYYGQGWFKTLLKAFLLFLGYQTIIVMATVASFLLTLILF